MRDVLIGQTDYSVFVKINLTTGAPATGLVYTDIDLAYARMETDNDATISDVTPATLASLTAAHSDWGFLEVDATNAPGLYRLDCADAVFASGAWEAVVTVTDASGTDFYAVDIGFMLVGDSPQTPTSSKTIGTATALGASAVASVNAEVDTALADIHLNDLYFVSALANTASSNTIRLQTSPTNNTYVGCIVSIIGGTGAGQSRVIISSSGADQTVDRDWITTPDGSSEYVVWSPVGSVYQTGDSYARIGSTGSGLTTLATAANLSTASTNISTLLSRLGSFTGTGVNTVLGFLKALGSKASSLTPSDMGGTYDNTTDSTEAIRDNMSSASLDAASVWSYSQRTLTGGAIVVAVPWQTGTLNLVRGDSYLYSAGTHIAITKASGASWPTDITGYTITATLKPTAKTLADNSSAPTITGTGTVVTATGSSQAVRIDLTAADTATLITGSASYKYDIQASSGSTIRATLEMGNVNVGEDQTTG